MEVHIISSSKFKYIFRNHLELHVRFALRDILGKSANIDAIESGTKLRTPNAIPATQNWTCSIDTIIQN